MDTMTCTACGSDNAAVLTPCSSRQLHGVKTAAEHLAHAAVKPTPDGFRLMALVAAAEEVEAAITAEVAEMRAQGDPWSRIATCLGVSRQAVTKRYGAS